MAMELTSVTFTFRVSGEPYLDAEVDGGQVRVRATGVLVILQQGSVKIVDVTGKVAGTQRHANVRYDDKGIHRPFSEVPWWVMAKLETLPEFEA